MDICPSILEFDASNYLLQIKRLSPYFKYFQIDIADGVYVDNKTASLDEVIDAIKRTNPVELKDITLDFHLMVRDYETEIKKLETINEKVKIKNVLVHFSVVNNFGFDVLKFSPFSVGIVLNPDESVENLKSSFNLEQIPSIQIMSVIPGAQGKPFMPETLNKIDQLRSLDYRSEIFLDGAVNSKTLPVINEMKSKPDFVCPGSYLTKCPDNELKQRSDYLLKFA